MSTIKVNKITNLTGSGHVEAEIPLKLKESSEPSAVSNGHGLLFVDSADNQLKYRHTSINSGNSVTLSSTGVSLSSQNIFTRGQVIDGTADEITLRVQGHSTQSSSSELFVVEKSDNSDLFSVDNTGNVRLKKDASVFSMGLGNDFTITHDNDTGATIAGSPVTITSAEACTWSTSSGILSLDGKNGVNIKENGVNVLSIDTSRNITIGNNSGETIAIGHTTSETTVGDNLTVAGNLTVSGILDNVTLQSYKETIVTIPTPSNSDITSINADLNDGNVFFTQLAANAANNAGTSCSTINFQNMSPGQSATLIIKNNASFAGNVTFSTVSIDGGSDIGRFPGNEVPAFSNTTNAVSIYTFFCFDSSNIYVMVGGLNFQ